MNWGELAGLEASGRRVMGHNGVKEAAMVDDYTAKMTELIELMRLIGNDTQQCEVKECKRKISSTITDTLSAFSNGSGGWIILVSGTIVDTKPLFQMRITVFRLLMKNIFQMIL